VTAPAVHLYRLLKWGRILARHGALRGIERDPNTPRPVRRIARLARFGARVPETPRYADAFQAIGPAAIKLGQTLATRPDLVGEAAASNLLRLQDALPPLPFAVIRERIETSYGRPLENFFASIEETPVGAASIAQVHRAVTTDGRHVAVKVLRPGIEAEFARAIDTYEWAAAQVEGMGGEAARLRPRLIIETFKRWTARELDLRREAASASELAEGMTAEPDFYVPEIDWQRTTGKVLTLEWLDGIKLSDRAALIAAGHDTTALAGKSGAAYSETKKAEQAKLEKACATSDTVRCEVVELYQGARQHLYKYQRYQDVRLVFAPENAIAQFGGDPDNFQFPRWCLDMGILRAYENDKPAKPASVPTAMTPLAMPRTPANATVMVP